MKNGKHWFLYNWWYARLFFSPSDRTFGYVFSVWCILFFWHTILKMFYSMKIHYYILQMGWTIFLYQIISIYASRSFKNHATSELRAWLLRQWSLKSTQVYWIGYNGTRQFHPIYFPRISQLECSLLLYVSFSAKLNCPFWLLAINYRQSAQTLPQFIKQKTFPPTIANNKQKFI